MVFQKTGMAKTKQVARKTDPKQYFQEEKQKVKKANAKQKFREREMEKARKLLGEDFLKGR